MILLKNISKTFFKEKEEIKALKDLSLEIHDGEIFGIIGFSGAGKSTLVRCINLLETPDQGGVVEVNGVDLTKLNARDLRAQRQKISMIFQHFNLFPSRTVLDNIIFPLDQTKLTKEEKITKAQALLEKVGLSNKINAYPSELSGGQKQRVAIARALASEPNILLCDEATSALDPQTTNEILELLKKLNKELNLTIVVITHEMDVVKDLCDRVAIMEHGEIVESGNIFEVFSNPQKEVTRRFINASSNLSKIENLYITHPEIFDLKENEILARLIYKGKGVSEPLLSSLTSKFGVVVNILLADVDLVRGSPIGGTVAILTGDKEHIQKAIQFIHDHNGKVEILHQGNPKIVYDQETKKERS